ncbi:MAG TPA: hypothetical protein VGM76_00895 [Lacipirellulaceae bacterium]|jgi:hypothetical protein
MKSANDKNAEDPAESRGNAVPAYPRWVRDWVDQQIDEALRRYKQPGPNYRNDQTPTIDHRPT